MNQRFPTIQRALCRLMPLVILLITVTLAVAAPAGTDDEFAQPASRLRTGILLFAIPELRDPNFGQTVVLLTHYSRQGANGLIINRPTEISLREALPEFEAGRKFTLPLFFGGPVSRHRIHALIRPDQPPEDTLKVFGNTYFTADPEIIKGVTEERDPDRKVRIYTGYAGWAPGQLENEVMRGDWVIAPADTGTVFSEDPDSIWPRIFDLQEQIEIRNPSPWPTTPAQTDVII